MNYPPRYFWLFLSVFWIVGLSCNTSIPYLDINQSASVEELNWGPTYNYFVIALSGPGREPENSERIARLVGDQLTHRNQSLVLADQLYVENDRKHERTELFEHFFYLPDGILREEVRSWTQNVGVDRSLICFLQEYSYHWDGDFMVKRIVLEGTCDDLSQGLRLSKSRVVVEKRGKNVLFDELEQMAAQQLVRKIWKDIGPQPVILETDVSTTDTPGQENVEEVFVETQQMDENSSTEEKVPDNLEKLMDENEENEVDENIKASNSQKTSKL